MLVEVQLHEPLVLELLPRDRLDLGRLDRLSLVDNKLGAPRDCLLLERLVSRQNLFSPLLLLHCVFEHPVGRFIQVLDKV